MAQSGIHVAGTHESGSQDGRAMAMITTLFFMWGFLTCLNDILVPHLKSIFDLNYAQVMLVQFSFFSAYFVFGWPAGWLLARIGYKKNMVAGLLTMAAGALLFLPAASAAVFTLFLGALVVLAAGITILQVSANPYVSVLGPARLASSRLNLTQAFNSLGTTIAPYFGSLVILNSTPKSREDLRQLPAAALDAYRKHEAASVKLPYLGITLALVGLAIVIALYRLPELRRQEAGPSGIRSPISPFKHSHLFLGAIAIFLYVGAEVSIGSFLVNYFSQPEIGGIPEKTAAAYVSFYWGGAMLGRFAGAGILRRVRTGRALGTAAIGAVLLVATSMMATGAIAMWTMLLVGLCNSIMFPSIFTLAIADLGPLTGRGSGLLVASIVGGAIVPLAQGALADRIGIHHAFVLAAACYLYIVYYGFRGSLAPNPYATSFVAQEGK